MFRIKDAPADLGGLKVVVDEDRDVWFQYIADILPDPGTAFRLVWHDRPILLEANVNAQVFDAPGKELFRLTRLYEFGSSPKGMLRTGIQPFVFANAEEKHEALQLAVEALLVFGQWYNGDRYPDGYRRVVTDLEGEEKNYTLSDFGYPGA